MNRILAGALILGVCAFEAFSQQSPDNNAWKGRLYCLAAWAKNANPEEPKSLQEAFLGATSLLPREIPGLQPLSFAVDTESEEARRWFGQGLACLHLLWEEEAERAFRAVVTADPECAMGYWGLAMVNFDRSGRAAWFARMARGKLRPQTPAAVRSWVEALARFCEDSESDLESRLLRFASELEDLSLADPEDVETKALYLRQLVLNSYRGGLQLRSLSAVDRLAAEIADADPGHPSGVSRLFLWMNQKPRHLRDKGLLRPGADLLPQWRFLSEAQAAAGQWEEGTESLLKAVNHGLQQRSAWFEQPILLPGFDETVEVSAQNLSRLGRVEDSLRLARAMVSQPMPAAVAASDDPRVFAATAYARGLRVYAQTCVEHGLLDRLAKFEEELPLHPAASPEATSLHAEISALAAGDGGAAPEWLSAEGRVARFLRAGKTDAAAAIMEDLSAEYRTSFLARALDILQHQQGGRIKEAMYGFDSIFRAAAAGSDSPLRNAQGFVNLAKLRQIEGSWELAPTSAAGRVRSSAAQVAERYRAGFPVGPDFSLPDGNSSNVQLADYRGKPVLVTFFLGAGCLQCVEQLHTFLPLAPEFEEAGIELVAVSSDPVEILQFTLAEERKGQKAIPFRIVSDSGLETFRRYFVYNEFEKRPVHGTFLLDGEGKVRWSTTANEPFMKPRWLLQESRRLLSAD
jgi:peroxiredoxin